MHLYKITRGGGAGEGGRVVPLGLECWEWKGLSTGACLRMWSGVGKGDLSGD